jgi:amino acid transporter
MQFTQVKRVLIGTPIPNSQELHERLDKVRALAIFASDPISSNAYATEAIMSILILLGSGALSLTMPLALGIAALVLTVVFSYIQTIMHYPEGGGAYTVAKDNLGTLPSLIAAAALLIDYVLTVSVSVAAGVRAFTSAFPQYHDARVLMALAIIALITWANLRGVRESGTIFAFPTYAFVGGVLAVILFGLVRYFELLGAAPMDTHTVQVAPAGAFTGFAYTWLLLRAFAAGTTALTGIEAISNGVQAFRPPESKNGVQTMVMMGAMAMSLFVGISFLATHLYLVPNETESILSQLARAVAGRGWLYYWVQLFTMLILVLAANTAYQDFPRLSAFLARDGFMPRWMQSRGDRLVYSAGIVVLAGLASLIVIAFDADEIHMLPLYALGVMTSFTLSQAGMVRLMGKVAKVPPGEHVHTGSTTIHYESGWWWKRGLNAFGAVVTLVVLVVLIVTKFAEGAWIVVLAVPLIIWLFTGIKKHYADVAESLSTRNFTANDLYDVADVVIVPIADVHRGTLRALRYARRISPNVQAVSIVTNAENKERLERRWQRFKDITDDVKLVEINYDFRDVLTPLVQYIEQIASDHPQQLITVVVPEFIPTALAGQLLHNQTANMLRLRLRVQPGVVVINVPYHI